jgi:hypothetical protein
VAATITKNTQTRKVVGKDVEETVELPSEVPQEDRDTLNELMKQAQTAYESYLQAQRKVATAYQERQRRVEESFKDIEEHAAKICAVAIEKASRALEKAEQDAGRLSSKLGKRLKELQIKSGRPFREKSRYRNIMGSGEMQWDWRVDFILLPLLVP